MRTTGMLLLLAVGVFAAAFVTRHVVVPNVVAISVTEVTQPLWRLELAFLLRATENIAVFGAVVVLAGAAVQWLARRRATSA